VSHFVLKVGVAERLMSQLGVVTLYSSSSAGVRHTFNFNPTPCLQASPLTLSRWSCACTRSTTADYGAPPQTNTTLKRLKRSDGLQPFIGLVPDLSMENEAAMPGLLTILSGKRSTLLRCPRPCR
jgi:hypothetical protein